MAKQNTNLNDQQQYNTLQHFDKMAIDLPWNDKVGNKFRENVNFFDNLYTMEEPILGIETIEEQNLSEKMSQLSTDTRHSKECLINEIKVEIEKIPDYLTKGNKSLQQIMYQALSKTTTTMLDDDDSTNKLEELRKISILFYKIMVLQTFQYLWTAYLKSGLGQLIMPSKKQLSYSITLPIWPKEIKTMLLLSKNMDKINENEHCLKLVNNQLDKLKYQLKEYQIELNTTRNHFQGYTLTMEKIIETYIEQQLQSFCMKIEHEIELIHHDYHIQALKIEYLRHNPNEYQVQLMKELCQSKYEQETTEQEYHFLQQQINYYNSPNQSFDSSSIAHSSLIDSVEDPKVRQELFQQYKEIAEQSRANIFTLYMKTAEEQREEYKEKHEMNLKKMWKAYHSSVDNDKISPKMLDLMHQRCMKISERIKCIYTFKIQSFLSKS